MVTGLTHAFGSCFEDVLKVSDPAPSERIMTYAMFIRRGQTVFLADTSVAENPDGRALADIAVQTPRPPSRWASSRGSPCSAIHFGQPAARDPRRARRRAGAGAPWGDFEFDGEMQVNVAPTTSVQSTYPFCRLTGPANVLVMPASTPPNSQKLRRICRRHSNRPVLQGPITPYK